jgi:hypothetical protein
MQNLLAREQALQRKLRVTAGSFHQILDRRLALRFRGPNPKRKRMDQVREVLPRVL